MGRKQMPKLSLVKKGECMTSHCHGILCVKWCDNHVVHLLTIVDSNEMVNVVKHT